MENKMNAHSIPGSHDGVVGITYASGAATAVFWGLKVSDICMIMSTLATFLGLALQVFLAMRRIHRLEHRQEQVSHVAVVTAKKFKTHAETDKQRETENDG
jgi:hypothetical protein